jgi:cell division cycle 2-like protein
MAASPEPQRRLYYPALEGCRSVDLYERLNTISEGSYGVVYRAREKATGEIVALKRFKGDNLNEGFPITALREIKTLTKVQARNPDG